jgi:phosphoadenosine phosphosulfate reductase
MPLGLLIEPGQDIRTIAPDLARFALVAVAFPKFTDGRGYSLAHQLRGSFGFAGELRATGEILFDQLQFLARCGFDSFEISDSATIRLLEAGRRPGLGIFYQPGLGPEIPERTRLLARRAVS